MKIEQIYTGCLAHGAYYIESHGEAAIIDPLREVKPYIRKAEENNAWIKFVLETHFHADFVSGHVDLATATGAMIVYGPTAQPSFPAYVAADGEELRLGGAKIRILHTPGHTMESTCYLLIDEEGRETALFTGDTLLIGDVGRPDLAQKAAGKTQYELAGILYDSLRSKIMFQLPGDIIIYPGHGAGSACGKNMAKETRDTLAHQLTTNYALRTNMTRDAFIREVTEGLTPPPAYFPMNVMLNKQGYEKADDVMARSLQPLTAQQFQALARETDAVILDTRGAEEFVEGFIPGAINIGLDGNFAPWAGALLPFAKQPLLIVTDPGREQEVIVRLSRIGYDQVIGYLDGGFAAWIAGGNKTDRIPHITAAALQPFTLKEKINVIDVRRRSEYSNEHVQGAVNIPLDYINENMHLLNKDDTYYVHCAGGYRSVIFLSILRSRGYYNFIDVRGGLKAIKDNGRFRLTDYLRPTPIL
ncbi:MBL fold metallo-hydrolase [Chitinophaga tropicalis]|uniref:MBL fold metallo-hydrolase n=1 Tax=Chitinophaga tropicalis TaxID=2683588 RepID=A0A7K1U4V3_9BACT|nr:MBL fold metallo-hydrolase [Chitinophaga tropicalis]MVT09025.1 MBL fold metallo-hydrolase [Chitinophaga tropicalis]